MTTGNCRRRIGTASWMLVLAVAITIGCQQGVLILPGEGTAGISIGDDAAVVVAALGEPESRASHGIAGAEGSLIEYYIYPARGIDVLLQNGTTKTIFLYNEGAEDHRRFEGRTPQGIHLGSTRPEVLKLMGDPDWRGEAELADLLFEYNQGIEFVFRPDDSIHNIVIKAAVP